MRSFLLSQVEVIMQFVKRALRQVREQAARPIEWVGKKLRKDKTENSDVAAPHYIHEITPDRFIARPNIDHTNDAQVRALTSEITKWVIKRRNHVQREIAKEQELAKYRDNKVKYKVIVSLYKFRDKLQNILDKAEENKE